MSPALVTAVSSSGRHGFSKTHQPVVHLVAGLGVAGDAHSGRTVQHLSRVRRDPTQPNLRQVHLLPAELFEELAAAGFRVAAGDIGENVTTRDVDLLSLPVGAVLRLGAEAVIQVTGLRNPCAQLDRFQEGLMAAVLGADSEGALVRKAGVMAVVLTSGDVRAGDPIEIELPPEPHRPLGLV